MLIDPTLQPLSMLTDLYQLTMAYGYWKSGRHDCQAAFSLFFRKNPFKGGYTVACGLAYVIELLRHFRFTEDDLAYIASLTGNDGEPLFDSGFVGYLRGLRFSCTLHAMPEGTAAFPYEPLLRVEGPLAECQLLETFLLNVINFQTLIATKAARVCQAAQGEDVIEFGARRAQGPDGAVTASRAAYIGGCSATSNVLAGKLFGIPVRGTHAHSWVMSFPTELEAFQAYADVMPNNVVLLVDTYDTLQGVRHAITVGQWLRSHGKQLTGIRLDSGDLAWLSIEARRLLDEAGFADTSIVASNDLDETIIDSLKDQGARINVWGVGTQLVTGGDQSALGGVYKLAAIRDDAGVWQPKIKLSEQAVKITNPGRLQVRRFKRGEVAAGDAIYDVGTTLDAGCTFIDPLDETRFTTKGHDAPYRDLLIPIFEQGDLVYTVPDIHTVRATAAANLAELRDEHKRFVNPHVYKVGLEQSLYGHKKELIMAARRAQATRG